MTLLNPFGLIGLLSLPVILTLHLLRRHQRRYIVSYLGLWAFLDTELRGPRARRLPITWLLLLDLLIATLLSLAWSQPRIIMAQPGLGARQWVILLDVSSSMRAQDGTLPGLQPGLATRFEQAKTSAAALLDEVGPEDVVTVLTFGRQARVIADSREEGGPNDLAWLAGQIQAAQVGETGHALREALALGQAALDNTLPVEFHVFTDASFPEDDRAGFDRFAYPLHWHLAGGPADNQAVLDLNATPLGEGQLQVFARIANFSSQAVSREAVLQLGGKTVDQAMLNLPADSTIPRVWQIPVEASSRPGDVVVSLNGADPLAEDDSAAVGLQPGEEIRVALVADDPSVIQQAIQVLPGVDLQIIPPAAYPAGSPAGAPAPFDLTIFRNYLPSTWPGGQVLVVDPPVVNSAAAEGQTDPPGAGPNSLVRLSTREVAANATLHIPNPNPLVDGIDFSGVRWSRAWGLAALPPGFTPLLQAGDVPILLQHAGPNQVTVLLADLAQGNFTKHPAYPILMANLVDLARQAPLPPSFQTGDPVPLPAAGSYRSIEVTPPRQSGIDLEQRWPAQWTRTLEPGLYHFRLIRADGSAAEIIAGARAGDAVESDIRPRRWAQSLATGAGGAGENLVQEDQPIDLRPWLLGAAIAVLFLEAIVAWRR